MKNTIKILTSGIVATVMMTLVIIMAPLMGFPKMNPAEMLSTMMGFPIIIGWLAHFMIGIIFSFGFVLINKLILYKISNIILKGVIFGILVFILAQMGMMMMSIMLNTPKTEGNMMLMMIGSTIGHIVYGISLALSNSKLNSTE